MSGWKHPGIFISSGSITKTVGSTVTNYTLHGKNLVHITQGTNWAHFFYDQSGKVAKATYNSGHFTFLYNMQGDVVGIVDSAGTEVVKYTYDAWGKLLSKTGTMASTFGTLNPFRYRGYVYDEETGLYYLRSRYYNPIWGRFLNADTVLGIAASLKNRNTYAYCDNNAINQSDASGHVSLSITSPLGDQVMSLREESAGGGGGAWLATLAKRFGRRTIRLSAMFAPLAALIAEIFAPPVSAVKPVATPSVVSYSQVRHLEDVQENEQRDGIYYPAFIQDDYVYYDSKRSMDYETAYSYIIGIAIVNEFTGRHAYYGVYTPNQSDAKALAIGTGCLNEPEVHGINCIGHYHSGKNRAIHIWFGYPIP